MPGEHTPLGPENVADGRKLRLRLLKGVTTLAVCTALIVNMVRFNETPETLFQKRCAVPKGACLCKCFLPCRIAPTPDFAASLCKQFDDHCTSRRMYQV